MSWLVEAAGIVEEEKSLERWGKKSFYRDVSVNKPS
jgi:hypothetical protein